MNFNFGSFSVLKLIGKMGHFKKMTRDQFKNRKGTENEILRFWGISKN